MTSRDARSTAAHSAPDRDRLAAGALGEQHGVPDVAGLGAGLADAHRAGHVGAVPVDDASEIDDDELAGLDPPVARAGVRLGAVRAGGHDRVEAHAARAPLAHRELEPQREVALGRPVAQRGQQLAERVVGDRAGGADPVDLARLLHHPQAVDHPLGGDELGLAGTSRANARCCAHVTPSASSPRRVDAGRPRPRARRVCSAWVSPITMSAATPAAASWSADWSR